MESLLDLLPRDVLQRCLLKLLSLMTVVKYVYIYVNLTTLEPF
jgi:hypothetical protein